MISTRLIELIEHHANALTKEVVKDLVTNPCTPRFRSVPVEELDERIGGLYRNLGHWIGAPDDEAVRVAYEDWGRRRYRQGILISEIVYALIIAKHHLRRWVRDHGLVEFSGDRVPPAEMLPVQLNAVQELNGMIGEFFDRALYHLVRGWELEAARSEP